MSFAYRHGFSLMRLWTATRSIVKHPTVLTEVLGGQNAIGHKLVLIRAKELRKDDVDVIKLKDFSIHLRQDDGMLSGTLYELGYIDPRQTQLFNARVKDKVVVDVGANLGWYTLNACAHGAKEVHAIEPEPTNIRLLKQSIALNGLDAKVYECAAGERDGTMRIYYQDDCNSGSSSAITKTGHYFDVPCRTLKSLGVKPDVLKIDVEYAEPMVLAGGLGMVEEVPEIFMEYGRKWEGYEALARLFEDRYRMEIVMWKRTIPIKKLSECKKVENVHLSLRR